MDSHSWGLCQHIWASLPEHCGIHNPGISSSQLPQCLAPLQRGHGWEHGGLMVTTSPETDLGNCPFKQIHTHREKYSYLMHFCKVLLCVLLANFGPPPQSLLGAGGMGTASAVLVSPSAVSETQQPQNGPWLSGGTGNPTMGKHKPGKSFVSAPSLQPKPKPTKHLFLRSLQEL